MLTRLPLPVVVAIALVASLLALDTAVGAPPAGAANISARTGLAAQVSAPEDVNVLSEAANQFVSDDGRFIVFQERAVVGTLGTWGQVVVWDGKTNEKRRVFGATSGPQPGYLATTASLLGFSPNGRWVLVHVESPSMAVDGLSLQVRPNPLHPGNGALAPSYGVAAVNSFDLSWGAFDIANDAQVAMTLNKSLVTEDSGGPSFPHLDTYAWKPGGAPVLLSRDASGNAVGSVSTADEVAITPDGSTVAFANKGPSIAVPSGVTTPTSSTTSVFVASTGFTSSAPVSASGVDYVGRASDGKARLDLSGDGRFVVAQTAGVGADVSRFDRDHSGDGYATSEAIRRDAVNGGTITTGAAPSISHSGARVMFASGSNLFFREMSVADPADDDAFRRVTHSVGDGSTNAGGVYGRHDLSGSGRAAVFASTSAQIVGSDTTTDPDVFTWWPGGLPPFKGDNTSYQTTLPRRAPVAAGDPVDPRTGAFFERYIDLQTTSEGLRFELERSYTSDAQAAGRLGTGWVTAFETAIELDGDGNVLLVSSNGASMTFTADGVGGYDRPEGALADLEENPGGGWILRWFDGRRTTFDSDGYPTEMVDHAGRGLTLDYTGDELTTVTDAAGNTATFTYTAGLLTEVSMSDGRSVSYGYTGGLLTSFTDVTDATTTYSYDLEGRLEQIVDPDGVVVIENTYGPNGRVVEQTNLNGGLSTHTWDPGTETATYTEEVTGGTWTFDYDGMSLMASSDPLGGTVNYTYDTAGNVATITDELDAVTEYDYDAAGRVVEQRGPVPGEVLEWTWNPDGTLASSVDGEGHVTAFTYVGGLLTRVDHPTDDVSDPVVFETFARNPVTGFIDEHTDTAGETTAFTYNAAGQVLSVTTPEGRVTSFTYDAAGHLVSSVDPRGNEVGADPEDYRWRFDPDPAGRVLESISPTGRVTTSVFTDAGRLDTVTTPAGVTDWAHTNGLLTSVEAPDGAVTGYGYDGFGNRTTRTTPGGMSGFSETRTFDDANDVSEFESPWAGATVLGRDLAGRPTRVDAANGSGFTTNVGSPVGPLFAAPGQNADRGFAHLVDVAGSPTPIAMRCGTSDRVLWYGPGSAPDTMWDQITFPGSTNPAPVTYVTRPVAVGGAYTPLVGDFDGDGCDDIFWYTPGAGADYLWFLEPDGTWDSRTMSVGGTYLPIVGSFNADSRDDIFWYAPGAGAESMWTFNATRASYTVRAAPPVGGTYTPVLGPQRNQIIWYSPSGTDHAWVNVTAGTTTATTGSVQIPSGYTPMRVDGRAVFHSNTGDSLVVETISVTAGVATFTTRTGALPAAATTPRSSSPRATFGVLLSPGPAGDHLFTVQKHPSAPVWPIGAPSGATIGYDEAGRRTSIDYDDPNTPDVTLTYDRRGLRTSMIDGTGARAYTHDARGRLTDVTFDPDGAGPQPAAPEFTYTYDTAGRIATRTHAGVTLTWTRDRDGLVTAISDGTNVATYGYDTAGNVTSITSPNGTVETRGYDLDGRLATQTVADATSAAIIDKTFTFNPAGQIARVDDTAPTATVPVVTYTYDTSGRLTEECRAATCAGPSDPFTRWAYDAAGRRVSETTPAGVTTSTYDTAGRLTSTDGPEGPRFYGYDLEGRRVTQRDATGVTWFSYDAAGRTAAVNAPDGVTAFSYDGDGRRVAVTDASGTTGTSWDPLSAAPLAASTDGTTSLVPAPDGGYAWANVDGDVQVAHTDQVHNPTVATGDSGAVTHRVTADAWGNTRTVTAVNPTAPELVLGHSSTLAGHDAAGLAAMGARMYDPAVAAFTSTDPWERPDGNPWVDVYAYTDGDPVSFWDPTGLTQRRPGGKCAGWAVFCWLAGGPRPPEPNDPCAGWDAYCDPNTVWSALSAAVACAEFAGVGAGTGAGVTAWSGAGAAAGSTFGAVVGCAGGIVYSHLEGGPPGAPGPR